MDNDAYYVILLTEREAVGLAGSIFPLGAESQA